MSITANAISAVLGYTLLKGFDNQNAKYLPQNLSILAEANTANQSGLSTARVQVTSAKQVAGICGWGSPAHITARMVFGAGGAKVPVYLLPQEEADAAVAKVITITPSGTVTANVTHYLVINGRKRVDNGIYAVNIAVGDSATDICNKMRTAVANVLGAPVIGTGTTTAIFTAKWKGLTSNGIKIRIDTNGNAAGISYGVVNTTAGSGTPAVTDSLALVGNAWDTLFINTYGFVDTVLDELEAWNGKPDNENPSGRYAAELWKPMLAFTGTTLDDPTSLTGDSARGDNVTIFPCPAPLSEAFPMEVATAWALRFVNMAQNAPHSEIIGQSLLDIPAPPDGSIPQMNNQAFREYCVNKGCSTVDLVSGVYKIVDAVTTYNVDGESPEHYKYPRDLNIYFNMKYRQRVLEQTNLFGKTLVKDKDTVTATNVKKPSGWKTDMFGLIKKAVEDALIVDEDFSKDGLEVTFGVDGNPNRTSTTYPIKISSIGRVIDTTVTGYFNT